MALAAAARSPTFSGAVTACNYPNRLDRGQQLRDSAASCALRGTAHRGVGEPERQPALGVLGQYALTLGIVLGLVAIDTADAEVAGRLVAEAHCTKPS